MDKEKKIFGAACFWGGVVVGFLLSPIKKGMYLGNNCGNTIKEKEEFDDKSAEEVEESIENNTEEK